MKAHNGDRSCDLTKSGSSEHYKSAPEPAVELAPWTTCASEARGSSDGRNSQQTGGTPLLLNVPVLVHRVDIVDADVEWGGGLGLCSSSDSDGGPCDNWRKQRTLRMHGARALGRGIETAKTGSFANNVENVCSSWRCLPDADIAHSGAQHGPTGNAERRVDGGHTTADSHAPAECPSWAGFVVFSILHGTDFVLRVACLMLYARMRIHSALLWTAPVQFLGTMLSAYIAFHDDDVLWWLHQAMQRFPSLQCCVLSAAFVVFGCFQVIQVKRAWARQLSPAEMFTEELEAESDDRAAPPSSYGGLSGGERIMPVALITGVPFLLVNQHYSVKFWCTTMFSWIAVHCSTAILLITVSLSIIEIDRAVSTYVMKRYHFNPRIRGTSAGRFQWLYPFVHIAFRAAEIFYRLILLLGVLRATKAAAGRIWLVCVLMLDYVVGLVILFINSPEKEKAAVHVVVAVGLLLADLAHFVDQPNFAHSARAVSRWIAVWRLVSLVALSVLVATQELRNNMLKVGPEFCENSLLTVPLWVFILAVVTYYMLLLSPPIRKVGHDLHTAAAVGDVKRIRKLLRADLNGGVLDVDAPAKDSTGMTPLMIAAKKGHVEVLQELIAKGAQFNLQMATGDTGLHLAAQSGHAHVCRCLLAARANCQIRNQSGFAAEDLISSGKFGDHKDQVYDEFYKVMSDAASARESRQSSQPSTSSSASKLRTVNALPCAGQQLRSLFPDADQDNAPSPRALQSLSALVLSRAGGLLARPLLARPDDREVGWSGSVPIGTLRRVGEIGRGGFGHVVEVEMPAAPVSVRRNTGIRRFALKLQLKHEHVQAFSEVMALRRADHPFIVRLETAFSTAKYFALLLELCPTDLNRILCATCDAEGRSIGLGPFRTARYMGQVLLALVHLHTEVEIVYRDVKPENILISEADEAKLTDFGLAKVVTSADRMHMSMCGTVGYAAPECFNSDFKFRSFQSSKKEGSSFGCGPSIQAHYDPFKADTYSFGVTLQIALLGEDAARKRDIRGKGPLLLPLQYSESEVSELMAQLRDNGRVSDKAYTLLVDRLLPFDQAKRTRLDDPEVLEHPFFLEELGVQI